LNPYCQEWNAERSGGYILLRVFVGLVRDMLIGTKVPVPGNPVTNRRIKALSGIEISEFVGKRFYFRWYSRPKAREEG
jgi:hypothetical protein